MMMTCLIAPCPSPTWTAWLSFGVEPGGVPYKEVAPLVCRSVMLVFGQ